MIPGPVSVFAREWGRVIRPQGYGELGYPRDGGNAPGTNLPCEQSLLALSANAASKSLPGLPIFNLLLSR